MHSIEPIKPASRESLLHLLQKYQQMPLHFWSGEDGNSNDNHHINTDNLDGGDGNDDNDVGNNAYAIGDYDVVDRKKKQATEDPTVAFQDAPTNLMWWECNV